MEIYNRPHKKEKQTKNLKVQAKLTEWYEETDDPTIVGGFFFAVSHSIIVRTSRETINKGIEHLNNTVKQIDPV